MYISVCATTGKRKACADCSCGLAEELNGEVKQTPKSSCGSVCINLIKYLKAWFSLDAGGNAPVALEIFKRGLCSAMHSDHSITKSIDTFQNVKRSTRVYFKWIHINQYKVCVYTTHDSEWLGHRNLLTCKIRWHIHTDYTVPWAYFLGAIHTFDIWLNIPVQCFPTCGPRIPGSGSI